MKKKIFAVALAATMALSSVMTAFGAAETISSPAWWDAARQSSTPVELADGESVTFKIDIAAAQGEENEDAAFIVEATDGTSFVTAGSNGDIWGAGTAVKDKTANATKAASYNATITRSGNNFTVQIIDNATGTGLHNVLTLTGNVEFGATKCYIGAQVGTMTVTQVVEKADTEAPAGDTDSDTTAATTAATEAPAGDTDSDTTATTAATEAPAGDTDSDTTATTAAGTTATTATTAGTGTPETSDVATTSIIILAAVAAIAVVVLKKKEVTE